MQHINMGEERQRTQKKISKLTRNSSNNNVCLLVYNPSDSSDVFPANRILWPNTCFYRPQGVHTSCNVYSASSTRRFSFKFFWRYTPLSRNVDYTCFQSYFTVMPQYTPPTPTRRNCFVASASAVWTQFATSSRRLPTDSVDLETDQTDSIAVWLREFW